MPKITWFHTFLETSWRASSSKAFTLFSLDVMICCSCLKYMAGRTFLLVPEDKQITFRFYPLFAAAKVLSIITEGHLYVVKWFYQSTGHTVNHDPLRQIHSVCNGKNHQTSVAPCWPIKQVIHHILFTGPQEVKLKKQLNK